MYDKDLTGIQELQLFALMYARKQNSFSHKGT
jgi:hypothetical protein